ncbi:SCO6745 family protein [Nocardia macrotermitis]|uniref:SCO6745 family protein n=1 Tax=Nocardia macrotermitis TaxID=2585198 RepID=UPI0029E7E9D5|nr:hypothetical protein [Nocardia macrotermitis]
MSTAAAVKMQIQTIGAGFMFSREAKAFGAAVGATEFLGPYVRGRGGVLGEVDADVVTSAFGFFPGEVVRRAWESLELPAEKAAAGYLGVCQDFGRRKLGGFDGAGRLAELLAPVAAAADPAGVALFAGWRALPQAADDPARAMQLIQVLRELRGGLHLIAVRASGLTPQQAVLIGGSPKNSGPDQARSFGWPEPYQEITPELRQRWDAAEALTDELIAPAFADLDQAQGAELAELLTTANGLVYNR